jgi:glycosyltransferase involved in cell wall biosynthesis
MCKLNTIKSLIFAWVLFSWGCYDCENKTREYENIQRVFYYNPSKNANFRLFNDTLHNVTKTRNKIPAKISDFTVLWNLFVKYWFIHKQVFWITWILLRVLIPSHHRKGIKELQSVFPPEGGMGVQYPPWMAKNRQNLLFWPGNLTKWWFVPPLISFLEETLAVRPYLRHLFSSEYIELCFSIIHVIIMRYSLLRVQKSWSSSR